MNSLLVHAEVGDSYFELEQPWFQSMVVGHHGLVEEEVAQVRARGVTVYRYINLWTAPPPEWVGKGNPFHDYVDNLVRTQNLYFRDIHGNPAKTPDFPEFGSRIIINWGIASTLSITALVQFLFSLDPGGIFDDQVWYRPDHWWFGSAGPVFAEMSVLVLLRYEIAVRQILNLLQGNRPTIINGSHEIPGSLYLENSQSRWQENTALWSPGNIFSVEASHQPACMEAVDLWLVKKNSWLAFTSRNNAFRDAAYTYAVNKRAEGGDATPKPTGDSSMP